MKYSRDAVKKTKMILQQLEDDLLASNGDWLCGDKFSNADIMWGCSLFRLKLLGNDNFWDNLPRFKAYTNRLIHRQSIVDAVVF